MVVKCASDSDCAKLPPSSQLCLLCISTLSSPFPTFSFFIFFVVVNSLPFPSQRSVSPEDGEIMYTNIRGKRPCCLRWEWGEKIVRKKREREGGRNHHSAHFHFRTHFNCAEIRKWGEFPLSMQMHFDAVTHAACSFWLGSSLLHWRLMTTLGNQEPLKFQRLWLPPPSLSVFFVSRSLPTGSPLCERLDAEGNSANKLQL